MQFGRLWTLWCESLVPKVPPQMIKRDCFVVGLKPTLRLKVELKFFESFKDAVSDKTLNETATKPRATWD